jgi:Flp pilus assembly protein TadG
MRLGNKGNVAIITALCLPVIVGGGAYGIEVGYWRYDQVRMQQAADAAAYAAAVVRRADGSGVSNATLTSAGTTAAASNGFVVGTDSITINSPSTATPTDANSVEAVISRTEPPIFTSYIKCMVSSWRSSSCTNSVATVKASSTASYSDAGDACVLALDPGASKAADFAGNSTLTLTGCSVMSNSLASNAFNLQGSSILGAPCIYSAGGAYLGGTLNLTQCAAVKTGQPPVADPYKSLTMPTPSNDQTLNGKDKAPQCGKSYSGGVTIKGTPPAVSCSPDQPIIIDGGSLTVNATTTWTCTGCTIVLTNGASLSINGSAHIDLSAPTTGTYKGMLFMSDRSNTGSLTLNGDSTSSITGAIYAPDGNVSYIGNFSGVSGCTQIVASTVSWSGSTTFADDCSAAGMSAVHIGGVVRLSA